MKPPELHTPWYRTRSWRIIFLLLASVIVLNLAGFAPGFGDWYATCAYPLVTEPLTRLCDMTAFPLGEPLMFAGIALVALALVLLACLLFLRRRTRFVRFVRAYLKATLFVSLVTLLLFTVNYLLPLHATPLLQAWECPENGFALEQLEEVRTSIVEGLNQTAQDAPRGTEGHVRHDGDVNAEVTRCLQRLGRTFPRLSGSYPTPKAALCSDVLEWMGIGGFTYPYTMEVTYNRYVSKLYYPVLSAHESVHHKGFYLESEAVFLAYLACIGSSDATVRYSGYQDMYYYVEDAYTRKLVAALGRDRAERRFHSQVQLSDQVAKDIAYDIEERRRVYEAGVNKQAEAALSGAAEGAAEYGWSAQGQLLQDNTYSGAVELLLAYTYGS